MCVWGGSLGGSGWEGGNKGGSLPSELGGGG